MMRYRFVQDDDCHWYLIPAEKKHQFDLFVEATSNDRDYDGEDFGSYMLGGGIEQYTFENPLQDS